MHLARHRHVLFGPLALIALTLAGCTMIGDTLGVSVNRAGPSACIKACVTAQGDLLEAEIQLHQAQIEACQDLHGPAKGACIEAEAARHEAAMVQISQGRRECMNNCHRQGTGSAG